MVVLADALFDNYFLACELRWRGIELVARAQAERVGSRTVESRPDGDIIVWQRPNKPCGMTGRQYRRYPASLTSGTIPLAAGRPRREGVRHGRHRTQRSGAEGSAARPRRESDPARSQ